MQRSREAESNFTFQAFGNAGEAEREPRDFFVVDTAESCAIRVSPADDFNELLYSMLQESAFKTQLPELPK